jgi:ferrous iron transport protein A
VRIAYYRSGAQMEGRVKDMGLAPGVTVKVLQNDGHGPLLLLVGGSRLALGSGMARKIMVTLEKDNKE